MKIIFLIIFNNDFINFTLMETVPFIFVEIFMILHKHIILKRLLFYLDLTKSQKAKLRVSNLAIQFYKYSKYLEHLLLCFLSKRANKDIV